MYLGIDIGTSGIKAVIVDDHDKVIAESRTPLSLSRPHPLWSEQNPLDWWTQTEAAVLQLDATLRSQVRAVGLSGQMHGAVLLDKARNVLRPAILWNDGRSSLECDEILAREPRAHEITGNLIMTGFTASKLVWVKKHEPKIFDALDLVLLPKDYIRLKMTGVEAMDMSDAAGTSWLDVAKRDWSDAMLSACDLTRAHMPKLVEGSDQTGLLSDEIAAKWGMNKVPVCGGGGDNAAGAVGVGVIREGDALLSLGTSGVIFAATDAFRPNIEGTVHAFCHALPNRWHQMSVILNAASCLDWVCALTGQADVPSMMAQCEADGSDLVSEIFLPYLSGERTPHNNPHAKGVFFGMTGATTKTSLSIATLQGVAFALTDGLSVLQDAGTRPESLTVIGGGARSPYWGRILASSLGIPLVYRESCDVGPALGAARLARLCLGEDDIETVCKQPTITQVIDPDFSLRDQLLPRYEKYKALYLALKPHFKD